MKRAILIFCSTAICSTTQAAPETASPGRDLASKRVSAAAHVSLGAPDGMAGASIAMAPLPMLELEVGAGVNPAGLQASAMLRARLVGQGHIAHLGAGFSAGPHAS